MSGRETGGKGQAGSGWAAPRGYFLALDLFLRPTGVDWGLLSTVRLMFEGCLSREGSRTSQGDQRRAVFGAQVMAEN